MTAIPDDTNFFGDLNNDGSDVIIEEWERVDGALAEDGLSEEERREFWRSLDPATPIFDMYHDLRLEGHDDETARHIIKALLP